MRERPGLNEALFREVNERLEELGETLDLTASEADFICECADPDCTDRIRMSLREYEAVRAHPTHFVVSRGHEAPEIEAIVRQNDRYAVVEKREPQSARLAEELDPRS